MALPKRTTCKFDGCENPPHIFPGGWRTPYCREHMKHRKAKQREGQPTMTGQMLDVLHCLRSAEEQGFPFVQLEYPLAHGATLKSLIERDWIFESKGLDGIRYKITGRGLKALKLFEKPVQRRDGICSRCGVRERAVSSTGRRISYCLECERERGRKKNAKARLLNIQRPCSRCHQAPCHQYSSGNYSTNCTDCERERSRQKNRRQRAALLEAVRNGAPIPVCKNAS